MASTRQLLENITKGKFKSLYYFYGAEDFRRIEAEKFVADHFLPDMQRAINYHRIDSKRVPAKELIARLSNLPMLGEKEVFIIGSFESFKPKESETILKLITGDDPNRVVILSSPSAKTPKKNSAFLKKMNDIAETVEFKRFTTTETQNFIRSRLAKNKITITNEAVELLTGLVSGDRGGLEAETNKLIDYKVEGEVTVEDIKSICAGYDVYTVFELGDVVIQGRSKQALHMIKNLLGSGISEDWLLSALEAHYITLLLIKNGKPPVGNRGFLAWKFRQQAQNYSNLQLEKIVIALSEANLEIRHQNMPHSLVLERLALSLSGNRF